MAAAKPAEIGQAFAQRLAAHLPEDQRADFIASLTGNPAVVEELGNGALRQADYSRVRTRQTAWFNERQAELDEVQRLKDMGMWGNGNGNSHGNGNDHGGDPTFRAQPVAQPPLDPNKAPITRADALAYEDQMIQFNSALTGIGLHHLHEFGEPLDTAALTQGALKAGTNIRDFYNASVAERRAAKQTEARTAEIAAAEARGEQRARENLLKQSPDLPYPVGSSAPTTLMGLRKSPDGNRPNDYSLDAAIATLVEETNKGR